MFRHENRLQYTAKPETSDPILAKKLQELIGGAYGEMTVMMQYLFQGWNCRGPQKYRDMLLDIGTEEIGHVEMLATMVAQLLEGATTADQEAASKGSSVVAAVMGGTSPTDVLMAAAMNPQHAIVTGTGAAPADSVGYPWNGRYVISSGNLLADFRANLTAESHGRLQAVRIYESTTDRGVKDMLGYMIARDTFHQHQWLAAIRELEQDALEFQPVPSSFPRQEEHLEAARQYWKLSDGLASAQGGWARGPVSGGYGETEFLDQPAGRGQIPEPPQPDEHYYVTRQEPMDKEKK